MSEREVRRAARDELALCHAIRRRVFVEGQGVPLEEDLDGRDGEAVHLLAFAAGEPVGTARMRGLGELVKAERVAVLDTERRRGTGRALMEALEGEARRQGFRQVLLHAQEDVIAFYERLGYAAEGERFLEAEIWHRAMRKPL